MTLPAPSPYLFVTRSRGKCNSACVKSVRKWKTRWKPTMQSRLVSVLSFHLVVLTRMAYAACYAVKRSYEWTTLVYMPVRFHFRFSAGDCRLLSARNATLSRVFPGVLGSLAAPLIFYFQNIDPTFTLNLRCSIFPPSLGWDWKNRNG